MTNIVTVTPAADQLLTTVGRVRRELGITTGEFDAKLADLISEASTAIASYSDRVWGLQTYTESVPGYGDTQLVLRHAPIVGTPSEVLYDSSPVVDFVVGDADAGILYRRAGWTWTTGWGLGVSPSPGREELPLFHVTYQAGYVLPGWATAALPRTLPADIERACVLTVGHWHSNPGQAVGITKKKVGDLEITYDGKDVAAERATGLPSRALALLPVPRMV